MPEDLAGQTLRVLQGDAEELEEDQVNELRWPLTDPLGSALVEWRNESGTGGERHFDPGRYRVFKLTKAGDHGRAVARVTRGHYIAITPRTLVRPESADAPPPVAPERVVPEASGLVAHHFLAGGERDGLLLEDTSGASIEIRSSTAAAYELVGCQIEDAHRAAGPLFGREPPRVRVVGATEPARVVAGFEGPSPRRRSREMAASFDELRGWFDQHEPGWFFVRLYDAKDELLDSLDFRYAKGLGAIEIEEHSPLPQPVGHQPVTVRFHVAPGLTLLPLEGPHEITSLRTLPVEGVPFPARPDAHEAILQLRDDEKGSVDVVVQVPRVWWAFTSEGEPNKPAWTDRSHRLSVDDLQPTSPTRLSVFLPAPGWADAILVGFRGGSPRRVPVLRSERRVDWPLRGLGDDSALRQEDECELLMAVETSEINHRPVTVAKVRTSREASKRRKMRNQADLSNLSAPRLMSVLTRSARYASMVDRRTIRVLRETYYRRARNGDPVEAQRFRLEGLALIAAMLLRGRLPRLPSRWRRKAEALETVEPAAVAQWQRRLRQAETPAGQGTDSRSLRPRPAGRPRKRSRRG